MYGKFHGHDFTSHTIQLRSKHVKYSTCMYTVHIHVYTHMQFDSCEYTYIYTVHIHVIIIHVHVHTYNVHVTVHEQRIKCTFLKHTSLSCQ